MSSSKTYNLIRALRCLSVAKEYLDLYKDDKTGVKDNSRYQAHIYQARIDWIINDAAHKQPREGEQILRSDIATVSGLQDKVALLPLAKQIELEGIVNYMLNPETESTPQ